MSEETPDEELAHGDGHTFVTRGEYRADRRETHEWRKGNEARLKGIEKKLIVIGLVLAALSAGHDIPWPQIASVLGW